MIRKSLLLAPLCLLFVTESYGGVGGESPSRPRELDISNLTVWDGHNDVPEQLRERRKDVLEGFDFNDSRAAGMMTDLPRLKAGGVGAQFWSVYVSADLPEPMAVQATLEQIDVMKRLIARHPAEMQFCTDTACVEKAWKSKKIASLIGMEGGHSIGGSLGVLRQIDRKSVV